MFSYGQIIGVDLSLTDTGVAIIARDIVNLSKHNWWTLGMLNTGDYTKDLKDPPRQILICNMIYEFVCRMHSPHLTTAVAIEDYAFSSRVGKSLTRAELGGMVKAMFLVEFGYPIYLIAPSALKRFMGMVGRDTNKDDMFAAASRRYGFTNTNDNIVDAYCLARYLAANKEGQRLTLVRNDPLPQYKRTPVQAPAPTRKIPVVTKNRLLTALANKPRVMPTSSR